MTISQIPSQRLAVVAGLASFAALAGGANAQMNDVRSHFNQGLQARRIGADQAPRTNVTLAGGCASGQFEQINQQPNAVNGYFSDTNCDLCGCADQSIADDFTLTNDTNILNIQFWGGYFPSNTSPVDNFTIVIRSDAGSCAGAPIFTQSAVPTTRALTGNVLFGVNEWCYSATINGGALFLPAGSYWIEIFNDTGACTGSNDDWFWETGNSDFNYGTFDSGFAFEAPGINWNCPLGIDMSMIICGDVAQDPPPPPGNECTSGEEAADQTPNGVNGYFSELSCGLCGGPQVIADNFLTGASGGELNNIVIRGGYFPSNIVPGSDNFTINLYQGNGSGTPLPGFTTLAHTVVSRTATGVQLFGVDEFEYLIDLGCTVTLAANTEYWLEIYNDTTTSTDDWFWETGNPGNGTVSGSGFAFAAPGDGFWNAFAGQEFGMRVCIGCDTSIDDKYCSANNNSTGAPADLTGSGGSSASSGTVTMTSAPVPNQSGIFFHAANQNAIPFGCSFLCATGGTVRGAVIVPSGNVATYVYDNSDAKHSLGGFVGNTRRFQYWYRDPMNSANCGGQTFNTSNAVEGVITP